MSVVTRYTVLHPSELSLPEEEAYDLSIASLRTWSTVLCYGIGSEALRYLCVCVCVCEVSVCVGVGEGEVESRVGVNVRWWA